MFDDVLSALEDLFNRDDFAGLLVLGLEDLAVRTLAKALLELELSLNFLVAGYGGGIHGELEYNQRSERVERLGADCK